MSLACLKDTTTTELLIIEILTYLRYVMYAYITIKF